LRFIDLSTGEHLPGNIENTTGGATWANDNNTIFYTNKDPQTLRHDKVLKFKLDAVEQGSELVYTEEDDTFYTGVYKSKSKAFIFIYSDATLSSEYRYLDANTPDGTFQIFQERSNNHEYSVSHKDDKFFIKSNWKARNFRLMETFVGQTSMENWKEVIPHRSDVLLESFLLFDNHLVIDERINGLTNLRIIHLQSKEEHDIEFQDPSYTTWFSVNPEFETDQIRIGYSSLTTPNSTYVYNMNTRKRELLKQQEVLGDFDSNNYESKRFMAEARDGVRVPLSLVYKKGIELNGKNPLLLYGYGSYGHTIDPYFSAARLSLLDRGFIFAIAHIRGSEMLGRQWYEDGKLLKKMNTFTDFIDCAEFLITAGYTNSDKLYAEGGSAGGLLMGAVINLRPDLFNGVIAAVPFVDVVTTMLDETIPLTTNEYDEWGNPNDQEYYEYMLSYSPYDNVSPQAYPNLLVTTGLHDSQVQYWEPAKWVAKLRDMKTNDKLLLLHTNMTTGHGGASGRFERYKEIALDYAFLLKLAKQGEKVL
jgi:oligopeptidase B